MEQNIDIIAIEKYMEYSVEQMDIVIKLKAYQNQIYIL